MDDLVIVLLLALALPGAVAVLFGVGIGWALIQGFQASARIATLERRLAALESEKKALDLTATAARAPRAMDTASHPRPRPAGLDGSTAIRSPADLAAAAARAEAIADRPGSTPGLADRPGSTPGLAFGAAGGALAPEARPGLAAEAASPSVARDPAAPVDQTSEGLPAAPAVRSPGEPRLDDQGVEHLRGPAVATPASTEILTPDALRERLGAAAATTAFPDALLARLSDDEETNVGRLDALNAELGDDALDLDPATDQPTAEEARRLGTATQAAAPLPPLPPDGDALDDDPPPREPVSPERVIVWVAAGLGGLLMVLGALFALVVISERGWLGPATRVAMGLSLGTLAWLGGTAVQRAGYRLAGSGLAGAGVGALYGALFASTSTYDLVPRGIAFAAMVAVSATAMFAADRQRSRLLAWLGATGGLLTPVLVSSGENNAWGLFGYLGVLLAGTTFVATRRGWFDVLAWSSFGAAVLHVGWTIGAYAPDQALPALAGALILGIPAAIAAASATDLPSRMVASATAVAMPLLALPWVVPIDPWFSDPRSGLSVLREAPESGWYAAASLLLLPLPGLLAARRRADPVLSGAMGAAAAALTFAFLSGAAVVPELDLGPIAVGLGLALLAPLIALLRAEETGPAPAIVLLGASAGVTLVLGALDPDDGARLALIVGLAGGGALLGSLLPRFGTATAGALAVTGPLWVSAVQVSDSDLGAGALAAAAVIALGLYATWPLIGESGGAGKHGAAPLIPLVVLFPLYVAWPYGPLVDVPGLLGVGLGAVATIGAVGQARLRGARADDLVLALLVGVALFLLSAAFPLQFESGWLTVSWALEIAALAWVSRRLTHPVLIAAIPVLTLAVASRLLLNPFALEYGEAGGWPIFNWTLVVWGVPTVALLVGAAGLRRDPPEKAGAFDDVVAVLPTGLVLTAIATGFALVNVEVSHAFQERGPIELSVGGVAQGMVRSVSWGAYGLFVLVAGLGSGHRLIRFVGFGIVCLAAAKVFAIDLWALSGFARVGSVFGLGVTLLLAAFLFERLVLRTARKESA